MADGPRSSRELVIDLADNSARTLLPASHKVAFTKILITGTAGADSAILLRHTATTVTNDTLIYKLMTTGGNQYQIDIDFAAPRPIFNGLFMDGMTNTWTPGSVMIIYLA